MSDRAIGQAAGLSAKTVATIRKCSTGESSQSNARVGKDAGGVPERRGARRYLASGPVGDSDGTITPPVRLSIHSPANADRAVTVEKLLHDPSLRNNERGKGLLWLLHINAVGADQLPDAAIDPSAPIR